jgi:hypothetical protein
LPVKTVTVILAFDSSPIATIDGLTETERYVESFTTERLCAGLEIELA